MAGHKQSPPQETRLMIIKTAKELFMQSGYRSVSTRQIADACGLTQPALYHHFSDKQSLYVEVMRTVCEGTKQALERIIRREQPIEECLFQVAYYMTVNHPEDLSTMFHDIRHELTPESQRIIYQYWHQSYLSPIISIFENGQQSGQLRSSTQFGIDAAMSARVLMGLISQQLTTTNNMGAPRSVVSNNLSKKNVEQQARMLVHVLLYGLSAVEPKEAPTE